ncbi:MAG: hypothetical protein E7612_01035 [Ruminococcaceae bacterium]|nr:hypothetical protein [Oscillospiraceae bacterium]
MSIFITDKELSKIRESREEDSQLGRLWRALKARTYKNTEEDILVQSSDTQKWWHLAWERIRDAASVYAIEPNEKLGNWVRDRIAEILHMPADEWIGPWFRKRFDPKKANLETAHTVKAVAEAYDLCPELFSDEEKKEILSAMREYGLNACREYLCDFKLSNWSCVIADAFAVAAVLLEDKSAIEEAIKFYNDCLPFYDSDGYGESLQYGNYASLSLSHMRDALVRYDASLNNRVKLDSIANTIRWEISSFLYMKPLGGERGDALFPRSINFGDSAAIFRPTADVLLQIAALYPDKTIAALARWLFDTTYANPEDGPDELATFGFYNHFSYVSLIYLPDAIKALSPSDAGMPLVNIYKTGTATIRDSWSDTATVLGAQVGYETHRVNGHRHADHNSFILAYDKERYFVDPGHCCYRLQSCRDSKTAAYHNTWTFYDEAGNRYTQKPCEAYEPPLNKLVHYEDSGNFKIIASDCAAAYGEHFKRAERVFVTAFPHVLFIIDKIETDVPMKMVSHFALNNRDNTLKSKIVDSARLVFRRGKGGIKFFTFADEPFELSQRWGYVHDNYHPLHNQLGQGKEGSSEIFDFTTDYKTSHLIVHPIVLNETDEVPYWHIRHNEPNVYKIQNRGNAHSWILTIHPEEEKWFSVSEE